MVLHELLLYCRTFIFHSSFNSNDSQQLWILRKLVMSYETWNWGRTTLIKILKVFVFIRLLWCTILDHHGERKLYAFPLNVQQLSVRAMNPWHFENLHNISAITRSLHCQYLLPMCTAVRTNNEIRVRVYIAYLEAVLGFLIYQRGVRPVEIPKDLQDRESLSHVARHSPKEISKSFAIRQRWRRWLVTNKRNLEDPQ